MAVGPVGGGRRGQEPGEVVRGPRPVRAVHRADLRRGQRRARVVGLDRGIVPGGHRAGEDLGDGGRPQPEITHPRDVVGERDRPHHHRQVDGRPTLAAGVRLGLVGGRQRRIRTGEVARARDEVRQAGAGTDAVVLERGAGAAHLIVADPGVDRVRLRRGALRLDRAGGTGDSDLGRRRWALRGTADQCHSGQDSYEAVPRAPHAVPGLACERGGTRGRVPFGAGAHARYSASRRRTPSGTSRITSAMAAIGMTTHPVNSPCPSRNDTSKARLWSAG